LFHTQTRHKIRRGLDAPLKTRAAVANPFGDGERPIAVHQKIIVYHPDELQAVASGQIAQLRADLLGFESVPLAAIDSVVGAVSALAGTRATGRGLRPAPPERSLVDIEMGDVVGLGRHRANRTRLGPGVDDDAAIF